MDDREDHFSDALDALIKGEPLQAPDELTLFAAEVHAIHQRPSSREVFALPPHLSAEERGRVWEAVLQNPSKSMTTKGAFHMTTSVWQTPAVRQPPGWTQGVARWQPVLSLIIMFGILAGLLGIAYTGIERQNADPAPTVAGLGFESTPDASAHCETYGQPSKGFDELSDLSIASWPERDYIPVAVADEDVGREIVELYETWLTCASLMAVAPSNALPQYDLTRFWSDRMQYISMLNRNPSFRPDELTRFQNQPSISTLLLHGALPLNRPPNELTLAGFDEPLPVFGPGEVYELGDGRYGAIIGSITTQQLIASQPESDILPEDGMEGIWLTFVAFVEQDGQFLVDEYVGFCVAPSATLDPGVFDENEVCT